MEVMKMKDNSYIKIQNVSQWYPHKDDKKIINMNKKWIKAVDDVSLNINKGEILGVIGESGCGKSTLGRVLARLEEPISGDVLINEISTKNLIKQDPKKFRRLVQIIFQNPFDTFTPRDTILEIMTRPLKIHNIGNTKEERYDIVKNALESGGLHPAEEILKRYTHELSGGQLQRISILRAMLFEPDFIIADEPVSMLDVSVRAEIINMLKNLSIDKNSSVIFISHDIALTRYISNKIAVMYLGKIVEYGEGDQVIQGEPPTPVDPGPGCYFAPRCYKAVKECFNSYPSTRDVGDGHLVACDRLNKK
jgi:oligopeptide/dipeptide ABC transporter ATP-binding protein